MTQHPALRRQTLSDLLHRTAARLPNKTGIVCGDTRWTWAQFDALVSRLAAGLHAQGVAQGAHVGVLARNSHGFAALRFALARLGAVLVPVNFMLNADEAAFILRHAGVKLLAVDAGLHALGRQAAQRDTAIERFLWLPSEAPSTCPEGCLDFNVLAATDPAIHPCPEPAFDRDHLLQIVYTSGTESSPKGAMLSHGAVIDQYVSCIIEGEMAENDVVLHALPLYHCAQLDVFLGPSVYLGSTSVITAQPTPEHLLPLIAQYRISQFFLPPTVWIAVLRSPLFAQSDLSSLRKGYYGASIMPVAVGEVGEIVHRSPQLLLGYFNDPERSAAAFEGGWFHSGDLGVVDDEGYISVVDRKKDMIKTGGENVASREVEEALYRLDGVSEVAVIGLPHPRWIEAVTAVVVCKPGAALDEARVIAHCAAQLAHFKTPKGVVFVDALPKNPSGKLLKRELRLRFEGLFNTH